MAQPTTPGVRYRCWRTVAFDGCSSIKVPDAERNRSWLGKPRNRHGLTGYPLVRLMTLVETGTRGLLGAAFGPRGQGSPERTLYGGAFESLGAEQQQRPMMPPVRRFRHHDGTDDTDEHLTEDEVN